MKQFYFVAAAAALLLNACSRSESMEETDSNAVQFGTFVDATNSRADVKTQFATGDSFGVFGYYTGAANYAAGSFSPNFMYNQSVTKGATAWGYSPIKYWPNNITSSGTLGKVSFFAYSPKPAATNGVTVVTQANSQSDPVIAYDAKEPTKQVDLLWGVNESGSPYLNQTKPTNSSDKIKFVFKHALARVGFEVRLGGDILQMDDEATSVKIDSIEFGGTLNGTNPDAPMGGLLSRTGNLNLNSTAAAANWTIPTTAEKYVLVLKSFKSNGVFGNGTNDKEIDEDSYITNTDDSYFMIIPQNFATLGGKLRITYTVTTTDSSLQGGVSKVVNKGVATISASFASGNAYKYVITLGLTSVKCDATVSPWIDTTVAVNL